MSTAVVVYDRGAVNPMEIHSGLSGHCDVVLALPPSEHNAALGPLIESLGPAVRIDPAPEVAAGQIEALNPDAVLTFSDRRLRLTAHLTERLGLPGHDVATAEGLTDKAVQRDRLRLGGVEATRSTVVAGPADWARAVGEVGLPAVLKPRRGEGSRDTHLVTDAAEGLRLVTGHAGRGGPESVLEEYLVGVDHAPVGDYLAVETVSVDGRHLHVAATGKLPLLPPFRETGAVWPAPLPADEVAEAVALTHRALTALGVRTGISHTEIKLTAAGPRIIEVNGRLGGFVDELSRHATGTGLVPVAARAALGEVELGGALPRVDAIAGFCFLYTAPAPVRRCRLLRADGAARVRRLPGVLAYRRIVQPGTVLEDSVTTRPLDVVFGTAATVTGIGELVAAVRDEVVFEFGAVE